MRPGRDVITEIRSVPLGGGSVSVEALPGQYALSQWPWVVSRTGGRGEPIEMLNLTTKAAVKVTTGESEVGTCSPIWCRMVVLSGNTLVRIDLLSPDGTQRRRVAGAEATAPIADVALLDRFIPLKTDPGASGGEAGLSLYDIDAGSTDLIADAAGNVAGRGSVLWWSTGSAANLEWHVLDLAGAG
jgi:hypothetical protein